MIRRRQSQKERDPRLRLRNALRVGVAALSDQRVKARVVEYFEKNRNFSRDAVYVAAVACRAREEQAKERRRAQSAGQSVGL